MNNHSAALILVIALVTAGLRYLPFLLFSGRRKPPKAIVYLAEALPGAVLGMLVIYCLKDVELTAFPYGGREFLACGVVAGIQAWKHSSILSILAGTAVYMLLCL